MVSQSVKKEEKRYAEDEEEKSENQLLKTPMSDKRRLKLVKKSSKCGKNPMKVIHNKIYNRKKARKLYAILKRVFKRSLKESFEILEKSEKSIVIKRPSIHTLGSISMSLLSNRIYLNTVRL